MRIDDVFYRSARLFPGTPAVIDAQGERSFAQLAEQVARLAALLRQCGCTPGDRVAVLAKNRWEYAALYFAAAQIDAVLVPLNWRLSQPELLWILADAKPQVLLAAEPFATSLAALRTELPGIAHWLALDASPEGPQPNWGSLPALLAAQAPLWPDPAQPAASDQAEMVQVYTSGTTGRPKGAILTHRNIAATVAGVMPDFHLRPGQDKLLQVTPLFHVGGMLMVVLCATTSVSLRLLPEFEPLAAARCLAHEGVTHSLMVPAMLRWMLSERGVADLTFPALRLVAYGAAPMPLSLLQEAMSRMGCQFFQGYGLSETAGVLTVLRPEDHVLDGSAQSLARLASAGRAMLGAQVRVVDAEGRDVPTGEIGEIVARGDCVSPGYWCLSEATREAHRGGWFWTGDVGTLDAQGYLTIVDRSKDMIVLGGENIYPREIELALLTHPAVADCAVIGVPHDTWGEEVLAFVSLRPDAAFEPRVLIHHCRQSLARYKCPTRIECLPTIPRNAAGKIEKAALRAPYWAGRAKKV